MKKTINIMILGLGFPNKGAELMLQSIKQWASNFPFEIRFSVGLEVLYDHRARYGLWATISDSMNFPILISLIADLIPHFIRERIGIISNREIDLYLDASGYAYGDPWGAQKAHRRLGRNIKRWAENGKPVIMLPQAFGPFESQKLANEMLKIIDYAALIFARDDSSYSYLTGISGSRYNIHRSRDITSLVEGKVFKEIELVRGSVGIIPNHKVFKMSQTITKEKYLSYLIDILNGLEEKHFNVTIILHEGDEDESLCYEVLKKINKKVNLLKLSDPAEIKMAIGVCSVVLTSRFHGFASALFQGVPALATTWSHKYDEFAKDFGAAELVLKDMNPKETIQRIVDLHSGKESVKLRAMLLKKSRNFKKDVVKDLMRIQTIVETIAKKYKMY